MSDEELFKAIKEYSEEKNLDEVRKANKILRAIKGICVKHNSCRYCPFSADMHSNTCLLRQDYPLLWEI